MARRIPEQKQQNLSPDAQPSAEGIPGGSAGIISDAAATITDPTQASAHAEIPADAPDVEVKRYRVENEAPAGKTGFPVLLDGCLSHLPKGKIISETAYDISKLESQGVVLKQV